MGWNTKFEMVKCIERPVFRIFKITIIEIVKDKLFGLELNFKTTKCRTTDISKFLNYEF